MDRNMKLLALVMAAVFFWTTGCSSTETTGSDDADDAADPAADDAAGDSGGEEDMGSDDEVDDLVEVVEDPDGDGDDWSTDVEIEPAPDAPDAGDMEEDEEDAEELPEEIAFTFAIIADPHVTGSGEHADRLAAAVAWINDNAEARMIEVVLVLGDICWGGGMELARGLLDELDMPYVPITGDNEVVGGYEEAFHDTFSDQYELLSTTLESWRQAEMPVWHPVAEQSSWLTNVAFEHQISRSNFVPLTVVKRQHDFDGIDGIERCPIESGVHCFCLFDRDDELVAIVTVWNTHRIFQLVLYQLDPQSVFQVVAEERNCHIQP